jgi:hypothetical protein
MVEAEKTACICSEYYPDCVWLATGGSNGVKWTEKGIWDNFAGREVILFPDVDAHAKWTEAAGKIRSFGINIRVYRELYETYPNTKMDIADVIVDVLKLMKHQQLAVKTKKRAVKTVKGNKTVAATCDKIPSLFDIIETGDSEVPCTENKLEPV